MMRMATIGLMTLSFALTMRLDVVAASHRTGSCCADASLVFVMLPEVVDVVLLANGRNGSAAADMDVFFFGDSNFRS